MTGRTKEILFSTLICLIILLFAGCTSETQVQDTEPEPETPTATNGAPPEVTPPVTTPLTGTPTDSLVTFFTALANADFETAKGSCTDEFWVNEKFQEMEDSWAEMKTALSEEEITKMMEEFRLDDTRQEEVASATTKIDGDKAVLTIIDTESETEAVFEFALEGGVWKINSITEQ